VVSLLAGLVRSDLTKDLRDPEHRLSDREGGA
jgi:hypothetical protein